MTFSNEALEAATRVVAKEMRQRTYDRHAYNNEVFLEGVADIALAALEAAAPLIQADAWDEGFSAALKQWRARSDVENPYRHVKDQG